MDQLLSQSTGIPSDVAEVKLCVDHVGVPEDNVEPHEEFAQVELDHRENSAGPWVFSTRMTTLEEFTVRYTRQTAPCLRYKTWMLSGFGSVAANGVAALAKQL